MKLNWFLLHRSPAFSITCQRLLFNTLPQQFSFSSQYWCFVHWVGDYVKGALAMASRNPLTLCWHTNLNVTKNEFYCIKIFFGKKKYCFGVGAWLGFHFITFAGAACQYSLSFAFLNLVPSRKTQHESSKIFFEHSLHVAKPIISFHMLQRALLWTAVCR